MKILVWKGFHGPDVKNRIAHAWKTGELLILCPPLLKNFDFASALGKEVHCKYVGDWNPGDIYQGLNSSPSSFAQTFAIEKPILGVFTSGTMSGAPRLVLYSRKNILSSVQAISELFELSRIKNIFCYAQPFHTFGLVLGYLQSMILEANLIAITGPYRTQFHEGRAKLTSTDLLTLGTPTHFYDLLSYVQKENITPALTYSCIIGGASVSVKLWNQVKAHLNIGAPSIGYGCTEASPGITHLPPGIEPKEDHEIGFPLPSLHSSVSSEGVQIRGPSLCLAEISNLQVKLPTHVTIRDRIEIRQTGRWIYKGRLDLCVNRGGEKHSLEAIEMNLLNELGIKAIGVGLPDIRLGEDMGLLVERLPESTKTQIIDFILRVSGFRLRAANIIAVDQFPVNASGKVDRAKAAQFLQQSIMVISGK